MVFIILNPLFKVKNNLKIVKIAQNNFENYGNNNQIVVKYKKNIDLILKRWYSENKYSVA